MAERSPLAFGYDGAAPVSLDEMTPTDTIPAANLPDVYVAKNTAITPGTATKITYDAKGLVTDGAAATQDDISDGTTYKQYSDTDKSKLFGIEALADVTDAVNVGASIHGVDEKATPIDADTMPIIDSADNALKKVTWANVKATLKAYFDALYTLANLGGIAHSLATAANDFIVASGSGVFVKKTLEETKAILGLGTIASQASNNVSITGGSVSGITDLAIADGGTGASTASAAFTALKQAATTSATGVVELATTAEDVAGTSSAVVTTPAGMAAKVAIDVNPKAFSQGVALTAATSGSSGIQVPDDDDIDFGTGNFTLVWKGSLPDWTPSVAGLYFTKIQHATLRWYLQLNTEGKWALVIQDGVGDMVNKSFLIAPNLVNGTTASLCFVVTRETVSGAGSFALYVNGYLHESIAIPAGTPPTATNSAVFNIMGRGDIGVRYESTTHFAATFNRALTEAEVLDLYRNGIAEADKWGSQTALTSGTLTVGAKYRINTYVASDDFTNVGAASNASGVEFTATGTTPTTWTNSSSLVKIGATLALLPEGIQPAPGQWLDASTNKLHAMQPAEGSSLTRPKRDFEFRSTNTWTASSAAQYIGNVNQICLTTKHLITDIISRTTVTTDVENIEIGDGSDADRYVAAVTPTAAPLVHTLANRINDGTNLKLVVTPAAEATMTIEFIVRGIILE